MYLINGSAHTNIFVSNDNSEDYITNIWDVKSDEIIYYDVFQPRELSNNLKYLSNFHSTIENDTTFLFYEIIDMNSSEVVYSITSNTHKNRIVVEKFSNNEESLVYFTSIENSKDSICVYDLKQNELSNSFPVEIDSLSLFRLFRLTDNCKYAIHAEADKLRIYDLNNGNLIQKINEYQSKIIEYYVSLNNKLIII